MTRAETKVGLGTARDKGGAKGWPGTWPTLSTCPDGYLGFLKIVLFSPILITKNVYMFNRALKKSIKKLNSTYIPNSYTVNILMVFFPEDFLYVQ